MDWNDVDAEAVKRMIAEADAEGREIPFDEIERRLLKKGAEFSSARPRESGDPDNNLQEN